MAARKATPATTQPEKATPETAQKEKEMPEAEQKTKEIPEPTKKEKALPPVGNPENTVIIGGKPIEIKATQLRYQRNRTAMFYRALDLYPLVDILAMGPGEFGDDRDGDKALMDWLIAVTNDEQLIVDNYDTMDTEIVEKMLTIFKRVNYFVKKEENLKNLQRQQKGATPG